MPTTRRPYVQPCLVENPEQFQSLAALMRLAASLPTNEIERLAVKREPNAPPEKEQRPCTKEKS